MYFTVVDAKMNWPDDSSVSSCKISVDDQEDGMQEARGCSRLILSNESFRNR